ncbi:MAG TPA: wax ester/triacylglycerol synthase family O-acyltransferase [Acidimicrobiales bacterium]|nr:wax ester/triacylglycerol synthase family O-acyltransferase [Acidimicrobiales bacterium]
MERLGGLDAAFLACETPGMHMHVGGLLVLDPATTGGDPYDAVRDLLVGALPQLHLMRKRLATVPMGIGRPYWVDDVDFDLEHHLRRIEVAPTGDDRALAEVISDVLSRPLDRTRPLWEAWFIEGLAGGRVALLAKMHHATIDGIEGVSVMGRLFGVGGSSRRSSGPGPAEGGGPWRPGRPPSQLELLGQGLRGHLADPLELVRLLPPTLGRLGATLWHARAGRHVGAGSVKPFTAPRSSFNSTLTPRRSAAFTEVSLTDVKGVKDAFGVKVNDVLTAVVGGALRRYLAQRGELPERPLIAAEPVSVHGRTGDIAGVSKLSVIFASLATDVDEPVERLRVVAGANARAKEISRAMGADTFTRWSALAVPGILSTAARLYSRLGVARHHAVVFNVLLSNVAGPPSDLYLAGARVAGIYAFGPITDGAGLNVTIISTGDRVGVGLVACPDLGLEVWGLVDAIPPALDELTAAVRLDQVG